MIVLKTIGYNNDLQPSNLCNQVPACHAKRTRMQEWADYIDAKIYILQYQNLQSNFPKGVWGIQWPTQQIYLQNHHVAVNYMNFTLKCSRLGVEKR